MEGVRRAAAVICRVGQWIDDLKWRYADSAIDQGQVRLPDLFLASIASHRTSPILRALAPLDGSGRKPLGAGCFLFAREASHRARRGAPVPLSDVHAGAKAARRASGWSGIDNHGAVFLRPFF
ncbi:MAG: hypothetical protein ACRD3G_20835 [Vicinamibacterales bacterium]